MFLCLRNGLLFHAVHNNVQGMQIFNGNNTTEQLTDYLNNIFVKEIGQADRS